MKISREKPDLSEKRWKDWHILAAADSAFSMLDLYARFHRGLGLDVVRGFAAAVNSSDKFGTLYPQAHISAIPSRFFHGPREGSALLEYRRCIADFVEANRRTILASRVLVDFHLTPAPVARPFVEAAEEEFRLNEQAGALTEVVIFL